MSFTIRRRGLLCLCTCVLAGTALLPLSVWGEVYRWVDSSGQVHFSDTPPPGGFENYDVPSPNTVDSGIKGSKDFFEEQSRAREEKARKQAERAAQRRQAARQCDQARARMQFLTERPPNRLLITGDDGQPARMTVEQWDAERAKAQARIDRYCGK